MRLPQLRMRSAATNVKADDEHRAINAFLCNGPARIGVLIVVISMLAAIFAPLLARYDPGDFDFANINQWPSRAHWFGTDGSGGDIFSQMVFSLRTSYIVAVIAADDLPRIGSGGRAGIRLLRRLGRCHAFSRHRCPLLDYPASSSPC